jgi:Zn-dependent protease with chaperone function
MVSAKARAALFSLFLLLPIFSPTRAAASPGQTPAGATAAQQEPAARATQAPAAKPIQAYTLPPEKYERAVRYARATNRLYFLGFVWSVVVLLLVLAWRLGPRYRDWVERVTRRRFLEAALYTPLLLATLAVLGLPTDLYGHWLSRHYGLSVEGWGAWAWDWAKMQLLAFVLGIFLVWILYGILRRSARRWWLYFWLASLPIIVFVVFISPVVIEPLFFKYQPLAGRDPALVAAIERVTARAGVGIPPDRMYWMEASKKLRSLNAYVSGFGASKRVVVWDTTIEKMTTPEILFVFGHELGHYVLHHIPKEMALDALVMLALLYLAYRGFGGILRRWGGRWAIRGPADWASLPALLLLAAVLSFLATPVLDGISRHFEHQADVYGLEIIHGIVPDSPQVAAQAFQVLGEVNLADPHPNRFIVFWLYTHPPMAARVRFALRYDPWAKGRAPRYVR